MCFDKSTWPTSRLEVRRDQHKDLVRQRTYTSMRFWSLQRNHHMRLSNAGLVTAFLYVGFVIVATVLVRRGTDSEDVLFGLMTLGLPWDLLFIANHGRYRPYLPPLVLAMNAATVYFIVASFSALIRRSK